MPKLLIIEGIGKGTAYEISGNTSIGRASSNLLQLFGKQISRSHALIIQKEDKFILRDLKSINGVYVNSKRITEYSLFPGDEIAIGTVKMIYEPSFEIKTTFGRDESLIILSDEDTLQTALITASLTKEKNILEETESLIPPKTDSKKITDSFSRMESINRRLKALYEIASLGVSIPQEEELLKRSCEIISDITKAERVGFIFSNESGEDVYPAFIHSSSLTTGDITLSQTILKEVIKNRRAVFSPDAITDARFQLSQSIRLDQVRSIICVPLITKNRLLGAIYADTLNPKHSFEEDDLHLLIAITQQLAIAIENTRLYYQLNEEVKTLRDKMQEGLNMVGEDKSMLEILNKVRKIAPSDVTILITGETGTGKELIANAIHYNSNRRDKPFIAVDCSTVPMTLLESELFGHEKGSFTGADRTKPGKFELAEGGTIFLDEISNMDLTTQAKFLRVLEERKFTRVGGIKLIPADVRLIAATNEDLETLIKQERFRNDLYYRLAVVPINLVPLRGRKSDIPLLAKHFLQKFTDSTKKNITSITAEAMKYLTAYSWPGNVRELRNVIERAVVLCEKTLITPEELPPQITKKIPSPEMLITENINKLSLDEMIIQIEKQCIAHVLNEVKGRKIKAAKILKISRPTLDKKIKEYGL